MLTRSNLNPLLIDTPTAIGRLTKMVSRFKSNVTVICTTNVCETDLKKAISTGMLPGTDFDVNSIGGFNPAGK